MDGDITKWPGFKVKRTSKDVTLILLSISSLILCMFHIFLQNQEIIIFVSRVENMAPIRLFVCIVILARYMI